MMNWTLVFRLAVIAVLAYSGSSKLGSEKTVREAAEGLGLYPRLAKLLGQWLAPVELLVAALMVFSATAYAGAVAALALFVSFTALIAWNLWQGRTPACACFGEARAHAISNWTLTRNFGFIALAAIVVGSGAEANAIGVLGGLAIMVSKFGGSATLAAIGLLQAAILIAFLTRRQPSPSITSTAAAAPPQTAAVGWSPGTLAPAFDLPSLNGERVTLQDLLGRGKNLLLFFTSADCRHCEALMPEVARWQEEYAGVLSVALVSQGSASSNRDKAEEFGVKDLLLQGGGEIAEAYRSEATPSAVVVGRDRRIASRVATGAMEIRHLVEAWAEMSRNDAPVSVLSSPPPADPTRLLVGDPAPPFKLPAVRGGEVDLMDFTGRMSVLLFWRSTCGFCSAFAPELLIREKEQTESSAQLAFLASGTREQNEAQGFSSPVLLDDGSIMKAYGVNGTPSAVLVDAEGKVASAVAVGSTSIQALLKRADLMAKVARRVQA